MPNDYRIGRLKGGFVVSWWGDDGKRRRHRLEARTRAEAEGEAADRVRTVLAKSRGSTIADLWELYVTEKAGRRVTVAMGHEWKKMAPFFGNLRPEQVTIKLCREYAATRSRMKARMKKTNVQAGTVWTELGHLRTVLVWAAKRHLIAFAPPIERPAKPAPKDRWLTRGEAEKLIECAPEPHIKLAIQLMLATAGRVGAILELTWERVDFDRGTVNLRTTDTGPRKGRAVVPMNDGLRASLSAAKRAAATDYVVEWAGNEKPLKSIKTGFKKAVKNAGLVKVTPHVLRHTAAVHMAAAGRPMEKISQYLGHSSTQLTERVYARFAPDHLREEAAILDFTTRAKAV